MVNFQLYIGISSSMSEAVTVAHSVFASVAHRYWNPDWDNGKNAQFYGADASVEGMGSNLRVEVALSSTNPVDERALLPALRRLQAAVDHQCLFLDSSPMRISTLENISLHLSEMLFNEPAAQGNWESLTVWESERLACTVRPDREEVTMTFRMRNLTLEIAAAVDSASGIAVARAPIHRAVEDLYVKLNEFHNSDAEAWSRALFTHLASAIGGLNSLRVDLGRHTSLIVHS
jgi:hypothetical protein